MPGTTVAARTGRRWCPRRLRAFAWLALLGMLLGPLAPRVASAREAEETEAKFLDSELEDACAPSLTRAVERRRRSVIEPARATEVRRLRVADARLRRMGGVTPRWVLPRRVPPSDDDPDESLR